MSPFPTHVRSDDFAQTTFPRTPALARRAHPRRPFVLYRCTAGGDDAPEYQTAVAERGNVVSRVSTSGSLQAVVTVDVGSQVSGRIQDLYADFNSPVKKGERIAKIDPALFQARGRAGAGQRARRRRANVTRLNVTADDAERQAKRAEEVYAQRLISETERDNAVATARSARASVEQAQGQLAQARAALTQAETNLRYTDILSPTDGVVISRAVNEGQTVAASLSGAGHLHHRAGPAADGGAHQRGGVRHRAPEAGDARDRSPSMRIRASRSAARIRDIRNAPQIVQNVVTYDAVIDVANPDLKLKPGMTATVSVVTDRRRDVLVGAERRAAVSPGRRARGRRACRGGAAQRERGQGRWRGQLQARIAMKAVRAPRERPRRRSSSARSMC